MEWVIFAGIWFLSGLLALCIDLRIFDGKLCDYGPITKEDKVRAILGGIITLLFVIIIILDRAEEAIKIRETKKRA